MRPPSCAAVRSAAVRIAAVRSAAVAAAWLAACPAPREEPGPGCAATDGESLARCVEPARWEADVAALAVARPPGSAGWQAAQDLCAQRLAQLGYAVERRAYADGVNVVGVREGAELPAERVLASAHYDSIAGCAGADDNASGVAGLLEAARVLAPGRFRRTLVVACWDQEERLYSSGGSRVYAAAAKAAGERIAVSIVFEMIGFRSDAPGSQSLPAGFDLLFPDAAAAVEARERRADFLAVVADTGAAPAQEAFLRHAGIAGLPALGVTLTDALKNSALLGDLRRSDHASFWEQDYPAIMLTDTADFRNPHYHCAGGADVPADLNSGFASGAVRAAVGALAEALEVR